MSPSTITFWQWNTNLKYGGKKKVISKIFNYVAVCCVGCSNVVVVVVVSAVVFYLDHFVSLK